MSGRRHHGFTLIEMIVAVMLFLIFITAVYGTLHAGQSSMQRAEEHADLYQTGRVLLAQLSAELAAAYQPAAETTSALIGEDTEGATDDLQADVLTLLTTAHAPYGNQPAGDRCRVTYRIGNEKANTQTGLYVEENFTPGLEVDSAETPEPRLLSPLVVAINYKYLPAEGEWEAAWTDQQTLPVAVRVELTLRTDKKGAKPLVLVETTNLVMATTPATGGANAQP